MSKGLTRLACAVAAVTIPSVAVAQAEIPAGTTFLVELRDKLEAQKLKRGKGFEARTVEALRAGDGSVIQAGTKVKGRVGHVEPHRMVLRFEQIEAGKRKEPLVATTVGVKGERDVRHEAGPEGEIRAAGSRGRSAAIGAAIGAAAGAGAGAPRGARASAIGAGAGAAAGAAAGAVAGGQDLVLDRGARLELRLDRPLVFTPKK